MKIDHVIVAVSIVSVAACGSSGKNESDATTETSPAASSTAVTTTSTSLPPTTTTTPRALDADELEALLVPLDELPAGYSVAPPDDNPNEGFGICKQPEPQSVVRHSAEATIAYTGGTIGPILAEGLYSYDTIDDARRALDAFRAASDACTTWEEVEDGEPSTWTVAPMSANDYTDDQHALRLTAEGDGFSGTFDIIAARHDNVLVVVIGASFISILGGGQVQPGDFAEYAELAIERVT